MKEGELLPIGSVVLLKNATHRLMVVGFATVRYDSNPPKVYDYWGSAYPEGLFDPDQHVIFNHKDNDKVISVGYSDDSEKAFRKKIENILKQSRDENGDLTKTPQKIAALVGKEE